MLNPSQLGPRDLLDLALSLALREHVGLHWSIFAVVLGRVQDEGLFKSEEFGEYATARAWAFERLHVPTERFRVLVEKLWPMMKRHRAEISLDAWAAVPQTRALLLAKVLAMPGVDVAPWFKLATDKLETSTDFRRKALRQLGEDPGWTTWTCRIPVTMEELLDEMLLRVLPDVLGSPHPDPERAKDKDTKFRCLEMIAAHVLSSYVPGEDKVPT